MDHACTAPLAGVQNVAHCVACAALTLIVWQQITMVVWQQITNIPLPLADHGLCEHGALDSAREEINRVCMHHTQSLRTLDLRRMMLLVG